MSERDTDDIDFEFFDEPSEEEVTQRRRAVRAPRFHGPRGPRRPLRPGVTPLLRLVGLIALAILVVLVLVWLIGGCGPSKETRYKNYIADVGTIAKASQQNGRALNDDLTTPGITLADLTTRLNGLAQEEQQNVDRASSLDSPGHLREANRHVVEALQLRVNGLRGLAGALAATAKSKNANAAGAQLAQQAQRLVASDVVWEDFFRTPSALILHDQGVLGVVPPRSKFVLNPDLASARTFAIFFQRIHGAASGGSTAKCPCGTGIESVKALPSGQALSTTTETTVVASTNLAFQVTVKNTGQTQVVQVPVTLTIEKPGSPITKVQRIDVINPGEVKSVTFGEIDTTGVFGVRTNLRVNVKPVVKETNTSNNSGTYPVIFSLGP